MVNKQRPVIAITMGDAAGIGPEIIVKALEAKNIYDTCRPLVVGEGRIVSDVIKSLSSPLKLRPAEITDEAKGAFGTIDLIDLHNLDSKDVITGKVCQACGRAAMEYVTEAAQMAL